MDGYFQRFPWPGVLLLFLFGKAKKNLEAAKQALLGKVKNSWWPATCH